ncbi:Hypothetical protein SRAE_1000301000 [Strongyloides ratti]|uniref:Uncharacterized protein n=1 Tax=Strongyloides ratti TaxID=34506 RepID=A0A090L4X8_STRRB|nr:Hypothetical protein SRAE_1000301000 [Strongyloides ratti]CEF64757.1 Hypothetical protein SRAE_1000301000 [Strongyloides ratti]
MKSDKSSNMACYFIILSYLFLLIYSKDIESIYDSGIGGGLNNGFGNGFDYERYDTNNDTAYKAANFCLGYYNKQYNVSYKLTDIKFAINETLESNSNINLMLIAKNNSKGDYEFQAIYKTGNNSKPVCNIVNNGPFEDIILPSQPSNGTIGTIKPATTTKRPTRTTTKKPSKKPTQKSTKKPNTKTTKKANKKPSKKTTKKPKGKGNNKGKGKGKDKGKGKGKGKKKDKKNSKNSNKRE